MTTDHRQNSETATETDARLSRRDLLVGAGALAATFASGSTLAASHTAHRHEDHAPKHPQLLKAINKCLTTGQLCITHCLVVFKEGDTSLAECAQKVHEMYAICNAYAYLVAANSTYVKDYAKICRVACDDCEKECRKHDDKHVECKDCGDACEQVVRMLKKTFV